MCLFLPDLSGMFRRSASLAIPHCTSLAAISCVSVVLLVGESSRGNTIRGNRTESLREANLPLRGSLRGRVFRGFQSFLEVFRDFQSFSRGFQRSSQRPSQREISLSEDLSPVAPNRVAP